MNPIFTAVLLLLGLTLTQTLVGMAMLRSGALHRSDAARLGKVFTLLVVALGFLLSRTAWLGLAPHPVDLSMFLLLLAVLSHSLIWAGMAFQIKRAPPSQESEDAHFP